MFYIACMDDLRSARLEHASDIPMTDMSLFGLDCLCIGYYFLVTFLGSI